MKFPKLLQQMMVKHQLKPSNTQQSKLLTHYLHHTNANLRSENLALKSENIALKAEVPIVMAGFDFKRKIVELKEPFMPTGDAIKDIEMMKKYYRTITGKYPELGVH